MNKTSLEIMQYNKHRSKDVVTADFLRNPRVLEADIIAVQEPWDNPYTETTHHPAKQTHELVFPSINETDSHTDALIEPTDTAELDLWLTPGTITHDESGHQTTIDLVFGSHDLSDLFLVNEIAHEWNAHPDHLPIHTVLRIKTSNPADSKPRRWK
ncbi:uncharacterized protein N7446_001138 [Penicillium canescens]|uniref:uncharacterized protein n=1 Tax=Penicillium canescens TaxID=5083 RepID=UPI0026DEF27E|nr:uncharacterized protein N7446_001138 [Penicillium canescens]KAJ6078202.1 hypothetical protein N7446_001138 [Penicillium canescens]